MARTRPTVWFSASGTEARARAIEAGAVASVQGVHERELPDGLVLRRKADESRNGERSSHSQHCRRIMMSIRDELLSGPLGFGAAPLGNMFRNIPEEDAAATVDAAWQQGARYFDTAPLYGAGMSELRLGKALTKHK